jgi:DNA-binding transcriptional LysR family regulator
MLGISIMNNEIDLNLLLVFDAVWRHRHISRAAIELNTSQPTVSNALRRLRDFTRDALFVRSGSGMEPTPFAEQLATDWCNGLSSVRRGLGRRSGFDIATDKRTFTIVMSDIAEAVILPHLLNACRESAPGIFFSTIQLSMDQTLPALRTGAVDLAVGYIPDLRSGVRPEQSDQRQPNQAKSISHEPRASRDSTALTSRIEFPTMTGGCFCGFRYLRDFFFVRASSHALSPTR